ncbi:hypothetical protein F5884DRAFT_760282 [Xylogone sp. PMI_703]|nr:hypothetical protein F5884DRAFT_760282 [Xylogone sp. PMI_703]
MYSHSVPLALLGSAFIGLSAAANCISSGDENTINAAFKSGGAGAVVQLCPGSVITVHNTVQFTADNQELSTMGYPTGSTRATILLVATDPAITTIVDGHFNGLRLLNIKIDGNRRQNGVISQNSGANIEMGGAGTGQIISHVASTDSRGWSCMHITEGNAGSGSGACTNATVTNNDIGPCGAAGHDSNGNALWADGISFACSQSLIQSNTVTGSTDGGIVLFGAPGTKVLDNTIISSSTNSGFGAINMVDNLDTYGGSYAGVVVENNNIHGDLLFAVGIGMGSCVWGDCDDSFVPLKGPAVIQNNVFSGNITFPLPLSGWANGITVTGNDLSGVNVDNKVAEAGNCHEATRQAFNNNYHAIYNGPTVTGSKTLQSDFVEVTNGPTFFICTTPPLPNQISWALGQLSVSTEPTDFATLHGGYTLTFDNGANIIVYNNSGPSTVVPFTLGTTVSDCQGDLCSLEWQGDGNWVKYYNGSPIWNTATQGKGHTLTAFNTPPWFQISDASGKVIWKATD